MAKPKHPVLTVKALTDWLKKQKRNRRYDFADTRDCLISRLVKSQGFKDVQVGNSYVYTDIYVYDIPPDLNAIAMRGDYTYAAALKRAQGAS